MNLWFRLLWLLLTARKRGHLDVPRQASVLAFRVWPHDLELSIHMNNGRYLTLMDLGRMDVLIRSGLWREVLRHKWTPIASAIPYGSSANCDRSSVFAWRRAFCAGTPISW